MVIQLHPTPLKALDNANPRRHPHGECIQEKHWPPYASVDCLLDECTNGPLLEVVMTFEAFPKNTTSTAQ